MNIKGFPAGFTVFTKNREYVLYAKNEDMKTDWIEAFEQFLSLKDAETIPAQQVLENEENQQIEEVQRKDEAVSFH